MRSYCRMLSTYYALFIYNISLKKLNLNINISVHSQVPNHLTTNPCGSLLLWIAQGTHRQTHTLSWSLGSRVLSFRGNKNQWNVFIPQLSSRLCLMSENNETKGIIIDTMLPYHLVLHSISQIWGLCVCFSVSLALPMDRLSIKQLLHCTFQSSLVNQKCVCVMSFSAFFFFFCCQSFRRWRSFLCPSSHAAQAYCPLLLHTD